MVASPKGGETHTLARAPVCLTCGTWFGDLRPVDFHRTCPHCDGAGCEQCAGTGLPPQAAAVSWSGLRFPELLALTVDEALPRFVDPAAASATPRLRTEITRRLEALQRVGLGYLAWTAPPRRSHAAKPSACAWR